MENYLAQGAIRSTDLCCCTRDVQRASVAQLSSEAGHVPLVGAPTSRNCGSTYCPMLGQGAIVKPSAASARRSLGRTTIELSCCSTAGALKGQGATEYLVLLAVVLIVALVSVALLGFFPGMASDSQITQSQMYWQSASPIAIIESGAVAYRSDGAVYPYLRVKNNGAYPIRITGIVGADGSKATTYSSSLCGDSGGMITSFFYLAPGEDKYFASSSYGLPCNRYVMASSGVSQLYVVGGASSLCQNSTASPGVLNFKTFGFEYIQYIEGQQITKRQIGKALTVKCLPPV